MDCLVKVFSVFTLISWSRISIEARDFAPALIWDKVMFENGQPSSEHNYRVPVMAIGPLNNTLVVFVEDRLHGAVDSQPKNIVYRYSQDLGNTW